MKLDAEEDGEQCGGQNASLRDAVGDVEAARQRPIVLHLTLLTFMELAEDGEKFSGTAKARKDFQYQGLWAGLRKLHIDPCSVFRISPVSASARRSCLRFLC